MPTGAENVLELSPPARRLLADMEVRRHGPMDTFPYEDRSLEKDPSLHRKPVPWMLRRTGVMWSRRRAPDTKRAAVFC